MKLCFHKEAVEKAKGGWESVKPNTNEKAFLLAALDGTVAVAIQCHELLKTRAVERLIFLIALIARLIILIAR